MTKQLTWRRSGVMMVFGLALMLLLSMSISLPTNRVSAQFTEPTATPADPAWLGFSLARSAIETEYGVNLRSVSSWTFFQDDWSAPNANHFQQATGIDNCVSTVGVVDARDIIFGWTFQIVSLRGDTYEARVAFDLNDVAVCDLLSAPVAPAADPESTPDPSLPAPVANGVTGGGFELGGHVDTFGTTAVTAMNSAGMTWVKKQFQTRWGVQAGYDMINDAKSKGFKILLGVVGEKEELAADPEGYADGYAILVGALAEAGADGIEVWNEPNIDREWPTGQISGANYTALLAKAYNAIKANSPNTLVISGAPAPTGAEAAFPGSVVNDDRFMQQMADAGAAQYMDCVGLHYNEGIVSPTTNSGDPRGEFPTYYFGSMTARGYNPFGGLPVCYTELGYLSPEGMGGPLPSTFAWASDVTVANQAEWLGSAVDQAQALGYVRLMIIWNVNFTRYDDDPMGGYAIIRPDGTCASCTSLGAAVSS